MREPARGADVRRTAIDGHGVTGESGPRRLHGGRARGRPADRECSGRLARRNEHHVEHAAPCRWWNGSPSRQQERRQPAGPQFEILGRRPAACASSGCRSRIAAEERRPLVTPGEAGPEVGVPAAALRRPLGNSSIRISRSGRPSHARNRWRKVARTAWCSSSRARPR